jgi:hypothetical protein
MPLGEEARTVKAGLRITKHEQAALSATFGSEGKGLRVLLDHWVAATSPSTAMAVAAMHETNRVARDIIEAGPAVEEALEQITFDQAAEGIVAELLIARTEEPDAPVHRHKRKTLVTTEWVAGSKVQTWACECGKEMR